MNRKLTEQEVELLGKRQFAHVATVNRDGSPQVTPVWVDTDGEAVIFNTAKGRVKYNNILRDPRICISIADAENPYQQLHVRGRATVIEEGAREHIDKMAKKYLDQDHYPWSREGEERVIVRLVPD